MQARSPRNDSTAQRGNLSRAIDDEQWAGDMARLAEGIRRCRSFAASHPPRVTPLVAVPTPEPTFEQQLLDAICPLRRRPPVEAMGRAELRIELRRVRLRHTVEDPPSVWVLDRHDRLVEALAHAV